MTSFKAPASRVEQEQKVIHESRRILDLSEAKDASPELRKEFDESLAKVARALDLMRES